MKKMQSVRMGLRKAALAILATCLFFSCSKEDAFLSDMESSYSTKYKAVVTVKTDTTDRTFFQLDESTTIEPVSWQNPYRNEVRALLSYTELQEESTYCSMKASVDGIESILTIPAESVTSSAVKAFKDGNDPVIIYPDWLSNCSDGYVTLHIAIQGSEGTDQHKFSLGINPSEPHELYLRHESNLDKGTKWIECMAAFRVRDIIPDTGDESVDLNLHYLSFDGVASMKFSYKTSAGKVSMTEE